MLFSPWDSPGKNTGVGCPFLHQGLFPTQGSNLSLLNCRQILYHLSHQGSLGVEVTQRSQEIWAVSSHRYDLGLRPRAGERKFVRVWKWVQSRFTAIAPVPLFSAQGAFNYGSNILHEKKSREHMKVKSKKHPLQSPTHSLLNLQSFWHLVHLRGNVENWLREWLWNSLHSHVGAVWPLNVD